MVADGATRMAKEADRQEVATRATTEAATTVGDVAKEARRILRGTFNRMKMSVEEMIVEEVQSGQCPDCRAQGGCGLLCSVIKHQHSLLVKTPLPDEAFQEKLNDLEV
ncbi:hypothetical protein GUJ93_ZPchr0001g30018 [Zizania palustris]|uniref:Uncharacterized protein n=1 Tax=Zizania palustris TaxID=103762 RepID=A0A8J5VQ64_ZIZPA|nr:hypothetical protein GUJ93_ZPchr0001g30018 [Zizania palustris]